MLPEESHEFCNNLLQSGYGRHVGYRLPEHLYTRIYYYVCARISFLFEVFFFVLQLKYFSTFYSFYPPCLVYLILGICFTLLAFTVISLFSLLSFPLTFFVLIWQSSGPFSASTQSSDLVFSFYIKFFLILLFSFYSLLFYGRQWHSVLWWTIATPAKFTQWHWYAT